MSEQQMNEPSTVRRVTSRPTTAFRTRSLFQEARRKGVFSRTSLLVVGALAVGSLIGINNASAAIDCYSDPAGPIVCENALPGSPASEWDVEGSGDDTIQGFSTDISVNRGQRVSFKIKTDAAAYTIGIYRLGWYQGNGARKVADVTPSATLPQNQPTCIGDPVTQNLDCGNWGLSASWDVPVSSVSGVYIALLTRSDDGGQSHIPFVVRDDASQSKIVFQTSDTTWQAYNTYGGTNLYFGPGGRAVKVSYNRPFATRGLESGRDYLFSNEYPMLRFLERNGYDTSYITGIDTDRAGALLLNHDTFVSVGHDEYWSGAQRANVEAARDAGVNLAFFSGNEIYWKTRYEPSIDGNNTAYRTLVTYKETKDDAKTDPSPLWTGTWRDPRFSPPSDGGKPENALSGTAYMSNFSDLPITVSDQEGQLRFWRSTGLGSQAPGAKTALAPHTVGYESDEDLDNGFRPAGLVRLSTTTGAVPEYLQDYGSTVAPGTTTHNMTLYRAASGALVFGAGTIQWPWGLDEYHDGTVSPSDPRMQQATVNLFSDMGSQPQTLMAGLAAPTPSSDVTAPTTVITSPSAGAVLPNGSSVTVTGTATDTGGVVAGVEVSLDGGTTWRRATGRGTWTYTGVATGSGQTSVRARAIDDSVNFNRTGVGIGVTVTCPCSLFGNAVPAVAPQADTTALTLGVRVVPQVNGWIEGVRFYKGALNTGTHTGTLWSAAGAQLATGTFVSETATGWQELRFAAPVPVTAGTPYVVSYFSPQGGYYAQNNAFTGVSLGTSPIVAQATTATAKNGVFAAGDRFPADSFRGTNYYVDVLFTDVDTIPPTVAARNPGANAASISTTAPLTVTFSERIATGSLVGTLADGTTPVPFSVSTATVGDATVATITPTSPLAAGTTYTVSVRATDLVGNAATSATTWTFRTARVLNGPGATVVSLFDDDTPTGFAVANDRTPVTLGVRFAAARDGWVQGVRFFKTEGNTGTHVATLWSSAGVALATATFTAETSSGWQEVLFSAKVPITKNTDYVVSYVTPLGVYPFGANGLAAALSRPPLSTPPSGAVYTYTSGAFPSTRSSANYFVDPIVEPVPLDLNPPTLGSRTPAASATSVGTDSVVSATFGAPIQSGSAAINVVDQGSGAAVVGTVTTSDASNTAQFTPIVPLLPGKTYQVTVSGARSDGGTLMTPVTWTFATVATEVCPCTLFGSRQPAVAVTDSGSAIELGTKFTPSVNSTISAIRFYKGAGATGTHVGTIWSAAGVALATVTFAGETASGWQSATLSTPLSVTAGATYTVSYLAPLGGYSATTEFFGGTPWTRGPLTAVGAAAGVFSVGGGFPTSSFRNTNYFVDVVAEPVPLDMNPPTVAARIPATSATAVGTDGVVQATFGAFVQSGTAAITVLDQGTGAALAGTSVFVASSRTIRFTPAQPLGVARTYQVTVSGAASEGGTVMAPVSWTFSTVAAEACPCTLFGAREPAVVVADSGSPLELGTRFTPSESGIVTAIRLYKGEGAAGTHVGTVWSAAGVALASATFTGETASGWQTATLDTPLSVSAGTTYTASYLAPLGGYSATTEFFGATPWTRGPLTAGGVSAGVFAVGGGFPNQSFRATNYFVDIVFGTTPPDVTPPTVTSSAPVAGATGVASEATVLAGFAAAIQAGTVTVTLTDEASATAVTGTTSYDAATRTVQFSPAVPLSLGRSYSATVAGARSLGGTVMAPVNWTFTTTATEACPCTLFGARPPTTVVADSASPIEVGTRFTPSVSGSVTGIRFYKSAGASGTHVGTIWSASGVALATVTFTGETASGWQTATLASPLAVTAGQTYTVSYLAPAGGYSAVSNFFGATAWTRGPLTAPASPNGVFRTGAGFPSTNGVGANYLVDVVFAEPVNRARGKAATQSTTAFGGVASRAVDGNTDGRYNSASVTHSDTFAQQWWQVDLAEATQVDQVRLWNRTDCCSSRLSDFYVLVSATDMTGRTLAQLLADSTVTKVQVASLADASSIVVSPGAAGRFVRVQLSGTEPLSLAEVEVFGAAEQPPVVASRTPAVAATGVGSDAVVQAGFTGAIQAGTAALTVTDQGTGAAVTGTTSYDATTRNVQFSPALPLPLARTYSATVAGARSPGGTLITPVTWTFTTAATEACPCTLFGGRTPSTVVADNAAAIEVGTRFTPSVSGTVTGIRFYKSAGASGTHVGTVWSSAGASLATVTFTGETASGWQTATLATPLSLTAGQAYTVSYLAPAGGYSAVSNFFGATAWTRGPLTAAASPNGVFRSGAGFPSTSGAGANYLVDVVFAESASLARGKAASQSSTVLLADAARAVDGNTDGAFSNGSVSHTDNTAAQPWWQVDLTEPTQVNQVRVWNRTDCCSTRLANFYVLVSPTDMTGRTLAQLLTDSTVFKQQVASLNGANNILVSPGVIGRYVRVQLSGTEYLHLAEVEVFGASAPPVVATRSPAVSATGVGSDAVVQAGFASAIQPGTATLAVTDQGTGTAVTGTTSYDAATRTVQFSPALPLPLGRTYSATVAGARSLGGTLITPVTWTFSTAASESCPCTLFGGRTPATAVADTGSVIEVGTRFTPSADGRVTGIRFYKSAGAAGTRVGTVWSASGVALATVTFTGETASGWQTATLAAPLNVKAGTTYTVSYRAPSGGYSAVSGFFGATPWTRGPLTAAAAPNGVFRAGGGFPSTSGAGANYLVDVVFAQPTNLAIGRTATQSTTFAAASLAIDGNTNGNFAAGSVSHTNQSSQPWWQVDLGATSTLTSVTLYNRTDCCGTRLSNFAVFMSTTSMAGRTYDQLRADPAVSTRQISTLNGATSISLVTGGVQARYVRVVLSSTGDYLHLAEVQVFGYPGATAAPATAIVSAGKTATQSSTNGTAVAGRAVDGSTNGGATTTSAATTNSSAQPWWQVDLAASTTVDQVRVWDRTNAAGPRLSNFYVFVAATDMTGRTLAELLGDPSVAMRQVTTMNGATNITLSTTRPTGRYVRVQLAGTAQLSLAEVQVFGSAAT